ncbi:MAG: TetR/AcrR family transcriptional regulator [Prevotellaceae bacterium]|jgi:AcrR family transcriptional regulator|nr:TetR/AcrR family transcriptional regulator [Prevotellaceae bacterium]
MKKALFLQSKNTMDNVKDRITQRATELFLKSGVKAVTMDDVASNLGMSKRTIYENFGDKLQLLRECLKCHNCTKQKDLDERSQLAMVELLYKMLKKADINIVEHSREFRFFQEIKKYYPTLHSEMVEEALREALEQAAIRISRGKEEGYFLASTNTAIAAYILVEQMDMFLRSDKFTSITDIMGLVRHILIIFFRGISTPKGIAEIDAMLEKVEEELKQK